MRINSKEELLAFLRDAIGPEVKDIVDERMAKALEDAEQRNKNLETLVARIDQEQQAKERKSLQGARIIRAMAAAQGDVEKASSILSGRGHKTLAKALGEGTGSTGGFLVSPETGEFIERLSADSVVRKLGARVIPMPRGQVTLPGGNTGATANWVGENSNAGSSTPAARSVTLSAKKLMVVVPISNELLNDASEYADTWVESEAKVAAALAEDLAFIRGAGGSNSPRGMYYRAASGNAFNIDHSGAAATATEIYADLGRAINKLASGDVKMINCGWAMSKRSEWHLRTLLNAHSIPIFQEEMKNGRLLGFPFASTTQIPNNLSVVGTADESEIYFADFYSCVIGETAGMEIDVMKGAAYYDSDSSAVVSGLSRDQTVVVLTQRVDFASLHQGADIAVIKAVDWGV